MEQSFYESQSSSRSNIPGDFFRKLSFGHIVFLIAFLGIPSLGIADLMVAATQIIYNAGSFIRKQFVPLETQ